MISMKKKLGQILLLFFVSSLSDLEATQYQISVIGSRGIHSELIKNLVEKELNESSSFIVIEREKADAKSQKDHSVTESPQQASFSRKFQQGSLLAQLQEPLRAISQLAANPTA